MKRSLSLFAVVFWVGAPQVAWAHVDILIAQDAGRIVTGGYDFAALPDDPVVAPPLRVFGYDFGEVPGQPDFTEDPGFVSLPGAFPPGTSFTLHTLGELTYWDGLGAVNFGAPVNAASLLLEKGSASVIAGAPGASLLIGSTPGAITGQDLHTHVEATLSGSPCVADGVYLLELSLSSPNGLADSDPFWIVYGHGAGEEAHEAAMEWVGANLAPEPAVLVGLCLGGVTLVRRQRWEVRGAK